MDIKSHNLKKAKIENGSQQDVGVIVEDEETQRAEELNSIPPTDERDNVSEDFEGDWKTYCKEIERLQKSLEEIQQINNEKDNVINKLEQLIYFHNSNLNQLGLASAQQGIQLPNLINNLTIQKMMTSNLGESEETIRSWVHLQSILSKQYAQTKGSLPTKPEAQKEDSH